MYFLRCFRRTKSRSKATYGRTPCELILHTHDACLFCGGYLNFCFRTYHCLELIWDWGLNESWVMTRGTYGWKSIDFFLEVLYRSKSMSIHVETYLLTCFWNALKTAWLLEILVTTGPSNYFLITSLPALLMSWDAFTRWQVSPEKKKEKIIITEIYFTLSCSSRTNSQEKSTHAGGTISVIVIVRPLGWEDKSV